MRGDNLIRPECDQIASPVVPREVPQLENFNLMTFLIDTLQLSFLGFNIILNHSDLAMDITLIIQRLVECQQHSLFRV